MSRKQIFKWLLVLLIGLVPSAAIGSGTLTPNSWDKFIEAIIYVESRGNVNAVNGNCVGPMQISPGLVTECNNILKKKKSSVRYTLSDRKSVSKSKEMFILIQEKFNPEHDLQKAARIWNAGPYSKPGAASRYVKKVMDRYL